MNQEEYIECHNRLQHALNLFDTCLALTSKVLGFINNL